MNEMSPSGRRAIPLHQATMPENILDRTMNCLRTAEQRKPERCRSWVWCLALLLLTVTGCALTTTYRFADRIILWQLDHYFDLNSAQRHDLTQRLSPLLGRHRQEALPQYETFLLEIRHRIERGLTGPDVDWAYATYDYLRADLLERLVVDGGDFLASVDSHQARTFESMLQKDNAKAERLVRNPLHERLNKRADAILDGLKDWLGRMSNEQRDQIRRWSLALPDTQEVWLAYRQQRQQELFTLLHHPRTPERAARELRAIFASHDQNTATPYHDTVRRMREGAKTMALAIDQQITAEQRRNALTKLQRLIDQVHDLQTS
ncbi:MAG TPA: DUF6279 family lipoprotein [Nitrospira sp.]|nr:DUF6279 family lipoprotein [Nitrospira sp.]